VGATVVEQVDSRKVKLGPADAVKLARAADHLWVARGKSVTHVDLKKDKPSDEELIKLMIGPTGNLRAPTIRRGKVLLVGFHQEEYAARLN
jgi:arsenate reductase-like glutaredoxin family protein